MKRINNAPFYCKYKNHCALNQRAIVGILTGVDRCSRVTTERADKAKHGRGVVSQFVRCRLQNVTKPHRSIS